MRRRLVAMVLEYLYPAIINDEEIDQEMFLTAEGREGIHDLIGGASDPSAWKYWRP